MPREIERDLDGRGPAMANGILDCFLSNAKKVRGRLRIELSEWAASLQRALNLVECAGGIGKLAQGPGEVAILQLKWGEPSSDEACVVNSAVDALGDNLELLDQSAARGASESLGGFQGEMQSAEFLANAIVEIMTDAAVLAFAHYYELAFRFVADGRGWHSGAQPRVAIDF